MYIQYLHCIHPPIPFACHFLPPTSHWYQWPPPRNSYVFLFSNFVEDKRKKINFYIFKIKIATQVIRIFFRTIPLTA
jgi:hypothetical protein